MYRQEGDGNRHAREEDGIDVEKKVVGECQKRSQGEETGWEGGMEADKSIHVKIGQNLRERRNLSYTVAHMPGIHFSPVDPSYFFITDVLFLMTETSSKTQWVVKCLQSIDRSITLTNKCSEIE